MDYAAAAHLAQTGMLFVASDSPMARTKPDVDKVWHEMAEALGQPLSAVPRPTVVIAPSHAFDQVWNALVNGIWSEHLKTFTCLHTNGEIQFIPR